MYKKPELQIDKSTPKAAGWYVEEVAVVNAWTVGLYDLVHGPVDQVSAVEWARSNTPSDGKIYQVFEVISNGNKTSRKKIHGQEKSQ